MQLLEAEDNCTRFDSIMIMVMLITFSWSTCNRFDSIMIMVMLLRLVGVFVRKSCYFFYLGSNLTLLYICS